MGAGCGNTNTPASTSAEPENTSTDTVEDTTEEEIKNSSSIILKAKATGNATVEFEWEVPKNLESEEGYRIVYSIEPNPTYPSAWWYERGPAHREKVWTGLPLGVAHFRLCAVVNDKCGEYSNDVELQIK